MVAVRTALLVVDMQNAFCSPEGHLARLGYGVAPLQAAIIPVQRLVAAAREAHVPVIFTRSVLKPDYSDGGIVVRELFPQVKEVGGVAAGSWDAEIIAQVTPLPGEIVIKKTRYSAFYKTRLEEVLLDLKVDTVLVCGVTTAACVESTARDACFRDFRVCLVADATAEVDPALHDAAIRTIQLWFGYVASGETVLQIIRSQTMELNRDFSSETAGGGTQAA